MAFKQIVKDLWPLSAVLICVFLMFQFPDTFNRNEIKYNDLSYLAYGDNLPMGEAVSSGASWLTLFLCTSMLGAMAYLVFVDSKDSFKSAFFEQSSDEAHYELLMA